MTDIVGCYREYYREQTPGAFADLFGCLLEYDFSSYHDDMRRVFAMHQHAKCFGESRHLFSGGSTSGSFTRYDFGPNFREARIRVEGFLRLSHRKTVLLADPMFGIRESPFVFYDSGSPPQSDFEAVASWHDDSNVELLFGAVCRLHADHGPINLCALPHIWLVLSNSQRFLDLELEHRHKINAWSTRTASALLATFPLL